MGKGNPNGRPPSLAPRTHGIQIRLNEAEYQRLEEAAALLNTTRTKVITAGIEKVHAEAVASKRKK